MWDGIKNENSTPHSSTASRELPKRCCLEDTRSKAMADVIGMFERQVIRDRRGSTDNFVGGFGNTVSFVGDKGRNTFTIGGLGAHNVDVNNLGRDDRVNL